MTKSRGRCPNDRVHCHISRLPCYDSDVETCLRQDQRPEWGMIFWENIITYKVEKAKQPVTPEKYMERTSMSVAVVVPYRELNADAQHSGPNE